MDGESRASGLSFAMESSFFCDFISNEGYFLCGDFVRGREIRELLLFVKVRYAIYWITYLCRRD